MGIQLSKFVNTAKTKYFWIYIVFGVLLAISAIILMPFWKDAGIEVFFANWGYSIVNIVMAIMLLLYLLLFLTKKINEKSNKVIKVLTVIEFLLFLIIVVGLILSQFNIIPVNEPSQILGLVLWVRGVVEIFCAYYYEKSSNKKYSVLRLIIAIILLSAGVFFIVKNTITRKFILWLITLVLLLCGLVAFLIGFIRKPKKTKKPKTKKVKAEKDNNKEELNTKNK